MWYSVSAVLKYHPDVDGDTPDVGVSISVVEKRERYVAIWSGPHHLCFNAKDYRPDHQMQTEIC